MTRFIAKAIGVGAGALTVALTSAYADERITVFEGVMMALSTLIAVTAFVANPNGADPDIEDSHGKHEA